MQQKGLRAVQRNLALAIKSINGRTAAGVLKAGLYVQARAMPETPVEYGKLRASAVTTADMVNGNPVAVVAYTAAYAPFVHENMEARHPVGKAKFLEATVMQEKDAIVRIIAREARIQ